MNRDRTAQVARQSSRRVRRIALTIVSAALTSILIGAGAACAPTRQQAASAPDHATNETTIVDATEPRDTKAAVSSTVGTTTTTTTTLSPTPTTTTLSTTATVPTLEQLYATVQDGVLLVQVSTCDGPFEGSGFLVGPRLLVTAAHVVTDALDVTVDQDGIAVAGTVLGVDTDLDVALVRLDTHVAGHIFALDTDLPGPGAEVAAIGFPLDQPRTLTTGTISGVERTLEFEDGHRIVHQLQTDVAVNHGNSGGPLLDGDGDVVGVVSATLVDAQGINYGAPAALARPLVQAWRSSPQPVDPVACDPPLVPDTEAPEPLEPPDPPEPPEVTTDLVSTTIESYFSAINSGNYEKARLRIAPDHRLDPSEWAEALSSTFDSGIALHDVALSGDGAATAWVTFVSTQAPDKGPRPGESCTVWSIDYTLVPADDGLLWIAGAVGHAGDPISEPCPTD